MQPQIAKMPGRDRKPTLRAYQIFIIQKKELRKKKKKKKLKGPRRYFRDAEYGKHFDAHVRTQVQLLDDRHHLHVSINVIIVVGNWSSSKIIAFRTLGETWGFAHR